MRCSQQSRIYSPEMFIVRNCLCYASSAKCVVLIKFPIVTGLYGKIWDNIAVHCCYSLEWALPVFPSIYPSTDLPIFINASRSVLRSVNLYFLSVCLPDICHLLFILLALGTRTVGTTHTQLTTTYMCNSTHYIYAQLVLHTSTVSTTYMHSEHYIHILLAFHTCTEHYIHGQNTTTCTVSTTYMYS